MKTNYLSKALILLSVFILITCKKEYVEYVKKDDIVINDNTVIFEDEEWDKNIESIDTANNIIIMKNNATTSSIKEGDVLISASGEGMLRIVTSVDATDENIEFVTEQGVITDVIEQGELVFNEKLTIPQIKSVIYHMEGVELDTIDYKQTGEALFNFNINTVIYDHDGDPATTNDQIRLTGSFSCILEPDIIIKITFPAILNEARIGLIFNENLNLNLSADFQYNIPYKEKLVASIELKPIIIPIAGVPVVLTPKFDIKLGTIGYINLSINTGLQQSVSYNAGAKYTRNQGWELYKNFDKNWDYYPPDIEANAGIKMSVIPELTIKLYGVVGPYFNMELYGNLDVNINQNPWWKLHGGINANVGAEVIVLGRTIAELPQTSIFSIEELIAQAPGPKKPTVTTAEVTDITETTAKAGGNVTSAGGGTVTERGIVYSTSQNPTTSDNKVPSGSGTGPFTAMMTNLNEGTKYYVIAYATNTAGTSYGKQVSFTTNTTTGSPPIADFTGSPTSGTAPHTVNFTDQSSNNPINWSWDFGDGTTSTQQNPSKTYNSAGTYTVKLTAKNSYGENTKTKDDYIMVTTTGSAPIAEFVGNPTSGTAPLLVNFSDQSSNNPINWSWDFGDGTTSTQQNPSKTYNNAGIYTVKLTAINNYGQNTVTKTNYIKVSSASGEPIAAFTGNPTSGDTPLVVQFTDQSTNNPTSWHWNFGDGGTSSEQNPLKTYYTPGTYSVQLTVTNAHGSNTHIENNYIVAYDGGSGTGVFTDARDGKVYSYVTIGSQVWMAENLKYLPNVVPPTTSSYTVPYHYVYGYNGTNVGDAKSTNNYQTYGVLYNWPASLQACPAGWHLPTDDEWTVLVNYLGGASVAGGKLKETGTDHWNEPNTGATNETGFTALPGGRSSNGNFYNIGSNGYWWSSNESSSSSAWDRSMGYDNGNVSRGYNVKARGYSVRCLRD